MKDLTRAWVLKAEADLETANREVAVEERPNYDAVCCHAHQCAERYLKARLQQEDIPFPVQLKSLVMTDTQVTANGYPKRSFNGENWNYKK